MKLSTKGRYGIRLMLDLACHYNKERPVHLKEISERQEISEKYLWHLINLLKTSGLITTVRGAKGGYRLGKPPVEITMKDIFRVVEGPVSFIDCLDSPSICNRASCCAARDLWEEAVQSLEKTLSSYTLEDMVEKQLSKQENSAANNYSI